VVPSHAARTPRAAAAAKADPDLIAGDKQLADGNQAIDMLRRAHAGTKKKEANVRRIHLESGNAVVIESRSLGKGQVLHLHVHGEEVGSDMVLHTLHDADAKNVEAQLKADHPNAEIHISQVPAAAMSVLELATDKLQAAKNHVTILGMSHVVP
jgi:hypothetical protein